MKNWLIGFAAVVALGVILFFSDRKVENPSGIDLIRSPNDYANANNKAATLAYEIFQRADSDGEVTSSDKDKLREAVKYFDAMNIFDPSKVRGFFGAGKCYMLLEDKGLIEARPQSGYYVRPRFRELLSLARQQA